MIIDTTIFDSLVGIDQVVGASTDKVNTLAGITDELIQFVSLDKAGDVIKLWGDIKRDSIDFIESEVRGNIGKLADYKQDLATTLSPVISYDYGTNYIGNTNYLGAMVACNNCTGSKLSIQKVSFVSDTVFSSAVKIFNLDTGLEVSSNQLDEFNGDFDPQFESATIVNIPFDSAVGINEISTAFEKTVKFGRGLYFVCVVIPSGALISQLIGNKTTGGLLAISNGEIGIATAKAKANITETLCYLHVDCQISYNFENVISENKTELSTAFKYIAGALLLERVLVSKTASRESLINREANAQLAINYREDAVRAIKNASNMIYKKLSAKNIGAIDTPQPTPTMYQSFSSV